MSIAEDNVAFSFLTLTPTPYLMVLAGVCLRHGDKVLHLFL